MHTQLTQALPSGTPPARERLDGGNVPTPLIRRHLEWVLTSAGEDGVARVRARLPADVEASLPRHLILFTTMSKQPFRSLVEVDRAIVAEYSREVPNVLERLGRYSAQQVRANGLEPLTAKRPHKYLETSAKWYGKSHPFATATYAPNEGPDGRHENQGLFTIVAPTCYSPLYCASTVGYYTEYLELAGARDVLVREIACACTGHRDCVLALAWNE